MRAFLRKAVAVAVSGVMIAAAAPAMANDSPVSGTGKGIVGGALLGEETGLVVLSLAGAKQTWMYLTIPTALAIGGGVAGHFIEDGKTGTDAQLPVYMLAAGMALIIPAVVITLSANTYNPGSEDSTPPEAVGTDTGTGGLGVQVTGGSTSTTSGSPSVPTPGASSGTGNPTTGPMPPPKHKPSKDDGASLRLRSPALVNLDDTRLVLSVPIVQLNPVYTREEIKQYGVEQRYQVEAPIFNVAF
jgi:hypothetical protein